MTTQLEKLYEQIGRQYVLNYRAIGSGLGTKKIPTCTKGWNCGYSCQSKNKKNCQSPLSGQAKTYADWLGKQAGGAIVLSKSGIQKTGEPAKQETPKARRSMSPTETIDRKYAKANPSEDDIDGWLKERLDRATSPEGLAISQILRDRFAPPGSIAWDDQPDYVKTADTKQSMINAMARSKVERYELIKKRGPITPEIFGFASESDIAKAEAKLNNPRTKNKAKAQKDLDRLKKDREEGLKVAERESANANKTLDQHRKEAAEEFDRVERSMQTESKALRESINKGDVDLIQRKTEEILRGFQEHRSGDDDINLLGTRSRQRSIVREYLSNKSKEQLPEDVLQIRGELTPDSVKAAYRKAARESHPDQGGTREAFEAVNEAYKKLQQQLGFSEADQLLPDLNEEDPWEV